MIMVKNNRMIKCVVNAIWPNECVHGWPSYQLSTCWGREGVNTDGPSWYSIDLSHGRSLFCRRARPPLHCPCFPILHTRPPNPGDMEGPRPPPVTSLTTPRVRCICRDALVYEQGHHGKLTWGDMIVTCWLCMEVESGGLLGGVGDLVVRGKLDSGTDNAPTAWRYIFKTRAISHKSQ